MDGRAGYDAEKRLFVDALGVRLGDSGGGEVRADVAGDE